MNYLLPGDVRECIEGRHLSTQNLALLFQRYLPAFVEITPNRRGARPERHYFDSQYVHKHLDEITNLWNGSLRIQADPHARAFADRHVRDVRSWAGAEGCECWVAKVQAESRLAIGLGSASVYENGLTLHQTLGLPYLPGSSVKGIVANWLLERRAWGELKEKADIDPEEWSTWVEPIFGRQDVQGLARFWDGIPESAPKLDVDIMNPHYQDYYEEPPDTHHPKNPPADWYQPVPVFFLTVAAGATFLAPLTLRHDPGWDDGAYRRQCELLRNWVMSALTDWGIGAKTRKGYGYVSLDWLQAGS